MNIKDFKWTEKRFGTRFANILKRVSDTAEEGGQEISNHFINSETGEVTFKDLDDNNHVLVTTEALQNEDSPVKELFDESVAALIVKNGLIEVKWQELKDKRDNGQLIPGSLYRITDYQCTTTQENTRSAGHQFDIVLLALSESKLAEEGWAMMNESNIYDVTFSDGVTKKCYLYEYEDTHWNLVDCSTLLGITTIPLEDLEIDENTKTIETEIYQSNELIGKGLTYNYFQYSYLSAWKVWYSLDNDTARFAWADDRLYINDNAFGNGLLFSNPSGYASEGWPPSSSVPDADEFKYCWANQAMIEDGDTNFMIYTKTDTPKAGDILYNPDNGTTGILDSDSFKGGRGGRGVIYRLIDEWGNDVPYDFKNVQFYIENTGMWVYAITDEDAIAEDPTLDGMRVKAIHLLSNYNNSLSSIASSRLSRTPLINTIFLNNNNVYLAGTNNTIVRDGENVLT